MQYYMQDSSESVSFFTYICCYDNPHLNIQVLYFSVYSWFAVAGNTPSIHASHSPLFRSVYVYSNVSRFAFKIYNI